VSSVGRGLSPEEIRPFFKLLGPEGCADSSGIPN